MQQGKFRIYRNLHKKCFSIQRYEPAKKGYRVYAHEKEIFLPSADFKVYEAGRKRVLEEGRKNVHAYIISESYSTQVPKRRAITEVYYNPYACESFLRKDHNTPVFAASRVALKDTKCFILY